ncbi:MAG: phage head closure protein [Parvibaculum sp.]
MIGDLRYRLVLETPSTAPDGGGGANVSWTELATLWADVRARRGDELDRADRPDARLQLQVRIRYRKDVSTAMRFREGARVFNIRSLFDEDGRERFLTCYCEEGGVS